MEYNNRTKKSQIGIFFLLIIILLIGAGLIFYINGSKKIPESQIQTIDVDPVVNYINSCIDVTGKKALLLIGKQGGYNKLPSPSLKDDNYNLPYYFYEELDLVPSVLDIEREISNYIDENIGSCINNFEPLEDLGYNIEAGNPLTTTLVQEDRVYFDITHQISVSLGEDTIKITKFNANIQNDNLLRIRKIAFEIVESLLDNPNKLCLDCIYDLAEEHNFHIETIRHGNNFLIFNIMDYYITKDSIIRSPYNFTFAVKYEGISCNDFTNVEDQDIILDCIEKSAGI